MRRWRYHALIDVRRLLLHPRAMFMARGQKETLRRLGLDTLEAVKRYKPAGLVKDQAGSRDVCILLRPPSVREGPEVMYLKRMWRVRAKDGLKSLLRSGRVQSIAHQEWLNYCALENAGLPIPQLVAVGEEIGFLRERFSFIITGAAPGAPLEDLLKEVPRGTVVRSAMLKNLALLIRRTHDQGLFLPDLFARHIFVENPGSQARFRFIDVARLKTSRSAPARLRARDLAALHVSVPLNHATWVERLRFLLTYGDARRLLPGIQRRAARLLRREARRRRKG